MDFKFKEIDTIFSDDPYYDLFDGGYIDPKKILLSEDQYVKLLEAMITVRDFLDQAEEEGILEYR